MTAQSQSMWVRCNQYMGVLDSLFSADSIYIVTRTSQRSRKTNIPTSFLMHTFRQKLWYFPQRQKVKQQKNNNNNTGSLCQHPPTWQWRSAAVWGRGHGRALVAARGRQTGWLQSLAGAGWRGRGEARGSPRWRWWRGAGCSYRPGDPGISLMEEKEGAGERSQSQPYY